MAPVTLIAVTSDTLPLRDLYGYADTIVRQRLSEIDGVGNIGLQGAAPASIRIAVDSEAIASFGLGFDDVRSTVQQSTMLRPLGSLDGGRQTSSLNVDDQLRAAEACGSLIIQTSNGAALRLSDVAVVQEDTADARVAGRYNGRIRDGRSLKESVTAAAQSYRVHNCCHHAFSGSRFCAILLSCRGCRQLVARVRGCALHSNPDFGPHVADLDACVVRAPVVERAPPAAFGALLALWLTRLDLSVIAFIGIILLIGIVKKNAILIVDFAIRAQSTGLSAGEAIVQACEQRLRPIVMTNAIGILTSLPLIFTTGLGSNVRQPLGVALAGDLIVSMILTLYSTPVIYLYLDRYRPSPLKRLKRVLEEVESVEGTAKNSPSNT